MTHTIDTICGIVITIVASCTTLLIADAANPSATSEELRNLLLPLIGSLLFCGGMVLLNPDDKEQRRIILGRAMIAFPFGVFMPSILSMIHPALAAFSVRPAVLLLVGGAMSSLVYVLSRPFAREMYERADKNAKLAADRLEEEAVNKVWPGHSIEELAHHGKTTTTTTTTTEPPAP